MSHRWSSWGRLRQLGAALLIGLAAAAAVRAQDNPELIHALTKDEGGSSALVMGPDGLLYGTGSGVHGKGTVFRLQPDGRLEVLHDFAGPDGQYPGILVLAPDGQFYGLTQAGGELGTGVAFRISPQGRFKLLHSFEGLTEGRLPSGNLVLGSDGFFYGTLLAGGGDDNGTVFRMKPNGELKVLHEFRADGHDGVRPTSLTEGSDGLFYGTTSGGGEHHAGTVFKMHRNGAVNILHSFWWDGSDGLPLGTVTEAADGFFYGVAEGHRENRRGLIYRFDHRGHFKIVYDFPPPVEIYGRNPESPLTRGRDGALYGTATEGGPDHFTGTIFRLTTEGQLTMLHSFDAEGAVGYNPRTRLLETADGEFVGATGAGGEGLQGAIYRFRAGPP